MLILLLWLCAAFLTFGTLSTIALVGKRREPITPGMAVLTVVINGVIVGVLVSAALAL